MSFPLSNLSLSAVGNAYYARGISARYTMSEVLLPGYNFSYLFGKTTTRPITTKTFLPSPSLFRVPVAATVWTEMGTFNVPADYAPTASFPIQSIFWEVSGDAQVPGIGTNVLIFSIAPTFSSQDSSYLCQTEISQPTDPEIGAGNFFVVDNYVNRNPSIRNIPTQLNQSFTVACKIKYPISPSLDYNQWQFIRVIFGEIEYRAYTY